MEDTTKYPPVKIMPQPPIPTVKIASDDTAAGYVIINSSDFDPETMKLFTQAKSK